MQAQAPVHVTNVQVGRGNRQLPSELGFGSPLSLNKKLFTDTDDLTIASKIVFFTFSAFSLSSVTSLPIRVWNWSQYIDYLNATPCLKPDETGLIYVWLLNAVFDFRLFDYVRLAKCLGEFDCVRLPNVIEVNRTIGLRLGSITESLIDYAGSSSRRHCKIRYKTGTTV